MAGYSGLSARIQLLQTDSSATIDLGNGRVITVHPAILEHLYEEPVFVENINER